MVVRRRTVKPQGKSNKARHFSAGLLPYGGTRRGKWRFSLYLLPGVLLGIIAVLLASCSSELPVEHDLSQLSFALVDQYGRSIRFPADFQDTVLLVAFIYTSCPDICPLTTDRMVQISSQIPENAPVRFVLITLDPLRDTPQRLREFAELYDLSQQRWRLLTADLATIDSLRQVMDIYAVRSPMRQLENGKAYYFINHTDALCLFDQQGRERQRYKGSEADIEAVVADVRRLLAAQ